MKDMLRRVHEMECMAKESSIDYPHEDLNPQIWAKGDGAYVIREDVEKIIYKTVEAYPRLNLLQLADQIRVVGSNTSNLYADHTDLDVHIVIPPERLPKSKTPEDWQKDIKKWYKDNRQEWMYIGTHPVEVYLQLNPAQDYMSVGVYQLKTFKGQQDEWEKGPDLEKQGYDPYVIYKDVVSTVRDVLGDTDELMGELKRDVIDYEVIKDAMQRMPVDVKAKLYQHLQDKVKEIEATIDELLKNKKEWIDMRKQASQPTSPEQALDDVELVKKWNDVNALFKFLDRYQYIQIIADLEKMMEDDKLSDDEIGKIRGLMGASQG